MAQDGIVAFFDIMGYQNIIDNNDIGPVTQIISGTLKKLPSQVAHSVKLLYEGEMRTYAEAEIFSHIETRLISDCLLISGSIADGHPRRMMFCWAFILYVRHLCYNMFRSGLPVRGAVDCGTFYLDGTCFAGKPIINCYRLAAQLNLSGVVLTETARDYLFALSKETKDFSQDLWSQAGLDCLVPLRSGTEAKLFMLNWWNVQVQHPEGDIRQAIFESFSGHNKDIPVSVHQKIENTEFAIRAFVQGRKIRVATPSKTAPDAATPPAPSAGGEVGH